MGFTFVGPLGVNIEYLLQLLVYKFVNETKKTMSQSKVLVESFRKKNKLLILNGLGKVIGYCQ